MLIGRRALLLGLGAGLGVKPVPRRAQLELGPCKPAIFCGVDRSYESGEYATIVFTSTPEPTYTCTIVWEVHELSPGAIARWAGFKG